MSQSSVKYRRDYTPPPFMIDTVNLDFIIEAGQTRVTSVLDIRRCEKDAPDLLLDGGKDVELIAVLIDGKQLAENAYEISDESLIIFGVPDAFKLEIQTAIRPQENTALEGLYQSSDMLCTQCEAEGFRHISFHMDRPDVMSRFKVKITADRSQYPVLLSNGNLADKGELSDNKHFTVWDDPWPKPAYLFALVAGNLQAHSGHWTTKSGSAVDLNIWVRPEDIHLCEHALQSLKKSMKWDEDVFGLEYDLEVYNIVAVGDFNMGAMENKGLNIFNTKFVLADTATATDLDFNNVEAVIGHEYFHNWTGNRVTCRDWFQLSLKEGLTVYRDQEFSADMGSRGVKRIDDVRLLRGAQFPEDAGPLAHPVRPDSYTEINNFYTATVYNKGAEVIRMMHRLIGDDAFKKGMDVYFDRHDGTAVTCEDFVKAMETASGAALSQFRRWYYQAGTPKLIADVKQSGSTVTLKLTQETDATPGQELKKPFHMPILIAFISLEGKKLVPTTLSEDASPLQSGEILLELKEETSVWEFGGLPEGTAMSLLRNFSAPVQMKTNLTRSQRFFLMASDDDPFARWDMSQGLAAEVILDAAKAIALGDKPVVPNDYLQAMKSSLNDSSLDGAMKAEIATLPTISYLISMTASVDIDALCEARRFVLSNIAASLQGNWLTMYHKNKDSDGDDLSSAAMASRRIANVALGYISKTNEPSWIEAAQGQYTASSNMTDALAALTVLVNETDDVGKVCLADFRKRWKDNALVMDKWFTIQAMADHPDVIDRVLALAKDPLFSLTNPNRFRSLVASFAMANPAWFHDKSGRGYQFLTDMIIQLDKINPQIAARMVPPLGRWKPLDTGRQSQMKACLEEILSVAHLSSDVRELAKMSLK